MDDAFYWFHQNIIICHTWNQTFVRFYSPTHKIISRSRRRAAHFINSRAQPQKTQRDAINYQERHRSKNRVRGMKGRPIEIQYKIAKIARTHMQPARERRAHWFPITSSAQHHRPREWSAKRGNTREVHFLRTTRGGFSTHQPRSLSFAERFLGLKRHRNCHCRGLAKKICFVRAHFYIRTQKI